MAEAVCRIVIVGGGVVDGRLSDFWVPSVAVGSGDEQHVVQIAWIGHGVLFVLQHLINNNSKLRGVFCRHAAVKHVGIIVVIH